MRHLYVNRATLLIGLLLVLAAALFGWLRSQGLVLVLLIDQDRLEALDEVGDDPASAPAPDDAWAWRELGADVFAASCQGCHAELPHLPRFIERGSARDYLVDFMLFGFDGAAVIDGERVAFRHPPFARLGDDELAASLNHSLTAWGNEGALPAGFELYEPETFEERRDLDLTREEVAEERPTE
jgi:hypothetical protein